MVDPGHAIGTRRTFIKNEPRGVRTALERFFIGAVLFPKLENLELGTREIDIRRDGTKHELRMARLRGVIPLEKP